MKSKKYMTLLLLAAMLLSCTAGCGKSATITDETTPETSALETEPAETEPSSGLEPRNFGGVDFTILCRVDKSYEFDITELTGNNMNDAVYERNLAVEEQYGVNLQALQVPGNWNDRQTFMDTIAEDVLSGGGTIDLVAGYNAYMPVVVLAGQCLNLNELPIVNLENPWWYSGFNDNMSVNNKLYMCLGDASLTMWEDLQVVFFNKYLMTDYGLEYPYEMVKNGTWTFDMLREYCGYHAADTDNSGKMDQKDNWGILYYNKRDHMVYFENPYTSIDENGRLSISVYNERFVEIYDTLYRFMFTESLGRQFVPDEISAMFRADQAMFLQAPLRYAEIFRDNESDFGIIPFPKYNESQQRYYTPVVDDLSVFCLPVTVRDQELCAYMLESLNFESSLTVVPEYFEVSLTRKNFRDNESGEMLEIIRDSVWFEFGYVYAQNLGGLGLILDNLSENNEEITSVYERNKKAYETGLTSLIEFYYNE